MKGVLLFYITLYLLCIIEEQLPMPLKKILINLKLKAIPIYILINNRTLYIS